MVKFNALLIAFLIVFALRALFQLALNRLNIRHLRKDGTCVPRVFQGWVDEEKLARISAYTADSSSFGIVVAIFDQAVFGRLNLSLFCVEAIALSGH